MPPLLNVPSIDLPLLCSTVNTTLSNVHHVAIENLDCGFKGDDNIYGLGIRLGFYIQGLSAILLTVFIPGDMHSRRNFEISMTFTFSTFVALIYLISTRPPSALYATEVFVIYSLCIYGSTSGDIPIFIYLCLESTLGKHGKSQDGSAPQYGRIVASSKFALETAIATFSSWYSLSKFALDNAIIAFSLWYWYIGIDNMVYSPCSRSAFFFTKVDLYHWPRTFAKVISTICAAWTCYSVVATILSRILKWWRNAPSVPAKLEHERPQSSTESDDTVDKKMKVRLFFGIATLPIVALFILGIELSIHWNHIEGVNTVASTGQLIPLVVAFAGLISVIYESYRGRKTRSSKSKQPDSISEPRPNDDVEEKTQPITSPSPNEELGLRPLDYHSGTSSSAPTSQPKHHAD